MELTRNHIVVALAVALLGVGAFFAQRTGLLATPGEVPSVQAADATSALMLSPSSIDFGELSVGMRDERSLIVTNTGDQVLFVTRFEAPDGFTVAPDSLELAPGASQAVSLQFAPTAAVTIVEAPLVVTAVTLAPQIVPVSALVLGSAKIHVEPLSLAFGRVQIDRSAQASIRIENRGDERLNLTGLATASPFTVVGGNGELGPGESTEVTVGFSPTNAGPAEGHLAIKSSDDTNYAIVVSLKGNGDIREPEAVISAASDTLGFGPVPIGRAATRYLELTNTGHDPLTISRIAVTPPFEAPKAGWQISPGTTYRVGFRFRPQRTGAALGPVTIYSNDPHNGALVITTVGEGIAANDSGSIAGLDDAAGPEGTPPVERVGSDHDGGSNVAATRGSPSGAPAEVANPAGTAEDVDLVPIVAGVSVADGSRIYIGTQSAPLSSFDMPGLKYDAATREFSADGMSAVIEFPLGDVFRIEMGAINGRVSDIGHFEQTVMLTLYDRANNSWTFEAPITTGDTAAVTPTGILSVRQGAPFNTERPTLTLNVPTPRHSSAGGHVLTMDLMLLGVDG